eukprot:scaffold115059_cov29-Tisochrysis_lutea.AAC.1
MQRVAAGGSRGKGGKTASASAMLSYVSCLTRSHQTRRRCRAGDVGRWRSVVGCWPPRLTTQEKVRDSPPPPRAQMQMPEVEFASIMPITPTCFSAVISTNDPFCAPRGEY